MMRFCPSDNWGSVEFFVDLLARQPWVRFKLMSPKDVVADREKYYAKLRQEKLDKMQPSGYTTRF